MLWNNHPEYDANVVAPASPLRKGYDANLLAPAPTLTTQDILGPSRRDDVESGRHKSLSGQMSNPEGADATENVEPKVATNSRTSLSTAKKKLYRTKKITILVIVAIVILAVIIGGAVGGAMKNSAPSTSTPSTSNPSTSSPSNCITGVYLDTSNGSQTIKCTAYSNRLADLARGEADFPIIGFHSNGGWNQKWTFHKQGICAKYTISTYGSEVLYANSNNLLGSVVYATSLYTIFTVELTSDDNYKIGIQSSNGITLYWTLNNEAEATRVILQADNGSRNQVWAIQKSSLVGEV